MKPARSKEDNDSDRPRGEILLVPEVLVRRAKHLDKQKLHLRHCQGAPGCVFQHGAHLLDRHAREPFNKMMG